MLVGVCVAYVLSYESKLENSIQTFPTAEGVNEQLKLKLTMTLEKAEYTLGEPINITLTITNIGNKTASFAIAHLCNRFDFRVYNDTNNRIYQWSDSQVFPQIVDEITLNAGESLTGNYVWRQTCNNTLVSEGVPVSPGIYYIVGQTGPIYEINGKIQTTPIQVTIVKP